MRSAEAIDARHARGAAHRSVAYGGGVARAELWIGFRPMTPDGWMSGRKPEIETDGLTIERYGAMH